MPGVNIEYKGESIATIPATGSKTIKTQGQYCEGDILVEYEAPPTPTLITKQITENGTYTAAKDNADGYSEVEVDVPSGGEYIHTRDIVLDEDVAEIAIEFSESTIAAYLDVDISIANPSGKTQEYIYPRFDNVPPSLAGLYGKTHGLIWKNSYTVFAAINNVNVFSVCTNTSSTANSATIANSIMSRKVAVRPYYADSVFISGGTIKIYECFGKGGT